ncbi:hypothetical protein B4U80_11761 [Leptotrombidium deliense]|uniref:Uncharacterized protein n=1 Tax=Leptotrombidium deliense TaxID=299467 RepID=A0A443S2T2_9ACAR|nr:hypothetical protein B4U80_11761 [Leptotrombidium deliense]
MNLVMVYQNELNLTLKEAFDKVYAYNEENLRYYMMYKERVQATVEQDIQFYLHGLEQLIVGSYEFHFDSNRYDSGRYMNHVIINVGTSALFK